MAVAAESSSSFHIGEWDFNEPVLNKIFYVDLFYCINILLLQNILAESLMLNKVF